MAADTGILVSICLCTYKRAHLKQTLASLGALKIPEGVDVEIAIADNDPDGSGRTIVDQMREQIRFPIHYEIEPRKGISHARNKTLELAAGDWIAFLDDDEIAEPDWLQSHLETADRLKADVLIGLVRPQFPPQTPDWLPRSGIYELETLMGATGSLARVACTSNAFVRAAPIRQNGLRFDPAYGRSGAEDNDFFLRLGRPVYCNREAVVRETLPAERTTLASFERRAASFGKAQARILARNKGVWVLIPYTMKSVFKTGIGAALSALFYPIDIARSRFFRIVMIRNFAKLTYLLRGRLDAIYG